MAFTNQTVTSMSDFLDKLNTFLAANGWTGSHTSASGRFGQRRTGTGIDIGFAAQYDTGTPENLGIYHFHGAAYNNTLTSWGQNDDSGNGFAGTTNANLDDQRFAWVTNTPTQFWCFEEDHYFHCVVQKSATPTIDFVHFGAGALDKENDWAGGEYVYGLRQEFTSSSVAVRDGTSALLDGFCKDGDVAAMEFYAATVHVTGLDDQPASGKYAVNMGGQGSGDLGNDRQGSPIGRIHFYGGFRAGPGTSQWGVFHGNVASGLLPGYPINVWYNNITTGDSAGPMGRMKDVRGISLKDYVGADEVTVGGDTWILFPTFRRGDTGSLTNTCGHQGIAYKKIV
jgi:hypothetical protein